MENIEIIKKELKEIISEKRYEHSIGVMKMAENLAKHYGENPEIAALAGLAHDIAKEIPNEEKLEYAKENNIEIDEIEIHNASLLHGKIGADITSKKYGFTKQMQDAIKYHTTANPEMDLLAKIIFVADKIEENRKYSDVDYFRNLAKKDIDICVLEILNYIINDNIGKGVLIHPDSILMRNKLLIYIGN